MPNFTPPYRHPGDPRIADPADTAATPIQLGRPARGDAVRAVGDSCRHLAGARKLGICGSSWPLVGLTASHTITVDDVAKEPFSGDLVLVIQTATKALDDVVEVTLTTGSDGTGQTLTLPATDGQTVTDATTLILVAGWGSGDATDFTTDSITIAFTHTSGTYTVFGWSLYVLPPDSQLSTS